MLNPLCLARQTRRALAIAIISIFACSSLFPQGVKKKVRFPKGTSSITIRDSVVRGDRDRYYVGAKAGQRMSVKITSTEKNAVFQIYFHGEEESLPGAGDGDDATSWSGELPIDNEYVIVVGGTRGNASYALTISIK
ncbi:MAG: hypothetical protein QOH70_1802 [Blastocatellia bacterium]|jgi:hypothetical protein|nr:hypothetical protein [Blastocatellia bacterium]